MPGSTCSPWVCRLVVCDPCGTFTWPERQLVSTSSIGLPSKNSWKCPKTVAAFGARVARLARGLLHAAERRVEHVGTHFERIGRRPLRHAAQVGSEMIPERHAQALVAAHANRGPGTRAVEAEKRREAVARRASPAAGAHCRRRSAPAAGWASRTAARSTARSSPRLVIAATLTTASGAGGLGACGPCPEPGPCPLPPPCPEPAPALTGPRSPACRTERRDTARPHCSSARLFSRRLRRCESSIQLCLRCEDYNKRYRPMLRRIAANTRPGPRQRQSASRMLTRSAIAARARLCPRTRFLERGRNRAAPDRWPPRRRAQWRTDRRRRDHHRRPERVGQDRPRPADFHWPVAPPLPIDVIAVLADGRVAGPIRVTAFGASETLTLAVDAAVSESVTVLGAAPTIDASPAASTTLLTSTRPRAAPRADVEPGARRRARREHDLRGSGRGAGDSRAGARANLDPGRRQPRVHGAPRRRQRVVPRSGDRAHDRGRARSGVGRLRIGRLRRRDRRAHARTGPQRARSRAFCRDARQRRARTGRRSRALDGIRIWWRARRVPRARLRRLRRAVRRRHQLGVAGSAACEPAGSTRRVPIGGRSAGRATSAARSDGRAATATSSARRAHTRTRIG